MSTTRSHGLVRKIAATAALAGALMIGSAAVVPQVALAADPGHSTQGDRHPGTGTYGDTHDIPANPTNRGRQVHAIPGERDGNYSSHGSNHNICAYKPYFHACH